jgi:hypothetical protein
VLRFADVERPPVRRLAAARPLLRFLADLRPRPCVERPALDRFFAEERPPLRADDERAPPRFFALPLFFAVLRRPPRRPDDFAPRLLIRWFSSTEVISSDSS